MRDLDGGMLKNKAGEAGRILKALILHFNSKDSREPVKSLKGE